MRKYLTFNCDQGILYLAYDAVFVAIGRTPNLKCFNNREISINENYNIIIDQDLSLETNRKIKKLAKEIEEKRTEADSTAFEGVHAKANKIISSSGDLANKLNMVTEALEGFEQRTVSAIAESSATVSKEVKDDVKKTT